MEMDRKKVIKGLQEIVNDKWMMNHADWYVTVCEDALALLKEDCHNCKLECLLQKYDQLKEKYDKLLKEQEAVVRCKDCKYWDNGYLNYYVHPWLPCMDIRTDGNWFCANGERKEGW